jgi:ribosomal protein S18 acetylase RimI-like enzyme
MIKISRANSENASEIKKLLQITWENTYSSVYSIEQIETITSEWHSLDLIAKQIKNPKILFLVAEENGQVIAMCNTDEVNGEIVNIQRIHVLPTHHRRGIGSLLMKEVMAEFPNLKKLELEVEKQNNRAIAFYEKQGFMNVGEKVYNINSVELPCFVMEKKFSLG